MRRAACAAALGLAVLLSAGSATALAGPGVTLRHGTTTQPIAISGAEIAAAADTGPTTYTLRDSPGQAGTPLTLHGVSIRGLLTLAGFDPGTVKFVQVVGGDGSVTTLTAPEINSPPYPEGPALVTDEGGTTRFFRPARSSGGTSINVTSVPGTPLEMTVNGGSLLSVRATASPTRVKVGQSVTFRASVRFSPPGATITYIWDFGDGTRGLGATVTHQYSQPGDLLVAVKAQGSGGSTSECATVCGGPASVQVTVTGRARGSDQPQGTPQGGGTSTNLGGTGTGGTGSGSGSGGGYAPPGSELGADLPPPVRRAPPDRVRRPQPHSPFSSDPESGAGETIVQGILLADTGTAVKGSLSPGKAAGSPKPQKGTSGTASNGSQIGASLLFAFGIVSLGALRERRRVRLRVA